MSQPSSGDVRTDSTNGNFRLSSLVQGKERDEGSMDCSGGDRAFTNESYTLWQLTAEDIKAKRLIIEDFGRRLLLDDSVNDIELLDLQGLYSNFRIVFLAEIYCFRLNFGRVFNFKLYNVCLNFETWPNSKNLDFAWKVL